MDIHSENRISANATIVNRSLKSFHNSEIKSSRRALTTVNNHLLPSNIQVLHRNKNNLPIKREIPLPDLSDKKAIRPIGQLPDGTYEEIESMELPNESLIDDYNDIWLVSDQPSSYLKEFMEVMPFRRFNSGPPTIREYRVTEPEDVKPTNAESRKFSFEDFLDEFIIPPPICDVPDNLFD